VADHRDRLVLLEERARERDRPLVGAQEVRVRDAARQHEPVVVRGARVVDRLVDGERVALVEVVERLHLAVLDRDEVDLGARLADRLPGLFQLDLLDALRCKECDPPALQLLSHVAHLVIARVGSPVQLPEDVSFATRARRAGPSTSWAVRGVCAAGPRCASCKDERPHR